MKIIRRLLIFWNSQMIKIVNKQDFGMGMSKEVQAKLFKEAAHAMKGLYDSFIEAGFTTQESLYLIA